MSVIDITRHHTLDHDHALAKANELADSLADRFDVSCERCGDTLKFSRTGVKGQLSVEPTYIHIRLELGLLLRPFKSRIEHEIHNHLDGLIEDKG
ncbi:MAG: polyhydroxyalkanoic acid system family protein [Pseudomonadales bacterium]|uniref:Polyhydroxyalkanoic acid system protein n=1 Tax=Oleiphilus messinensis TaxID=141451 RepID=A0A1Y0I6R6_9GAMM|nr:polyhydroxyalkanoic acid system family protein [Oleiphilus messinensis]ARU55093.1 polyhydroxyalkanoic acid system protein [Oleiphilus messinensis]MCG8610553.1 polyhydroxyalkanoic acid system family protein [Pseudomonadales bacterium]